MGDGTTERLLDYGEKKTGNDLKGRVYEESRKIWTVALPGILSRVTSFGSLVVTQSFIGHVSSLDDAGYALIQILAVRFINGVLIGMSSATETLCGQAYGAKQYHMMGVYLQRSWIVEIVTLMILTPLFIFATPIFKLIGQDQLIAESAGYIAWWFIPVNVSFALSWTMQMYLQAQQKNMIVAWLSILQFIVHIPLSWLLVYVFRFGVTGSMVALNISCWVIVIGEFIYIVGGWCPNTWTGFTKAALKDIFPVVKLSISSGAMVCLEVWYNAILVLLAGYMKNAEVAISAFSICLNINGWEFMISLGFLGAACVRIANELGRGDANTARFSIKVLLATSLAVGLLFWALCLGTGSFVGYWFTNDKAVADAVADLTVLNAFSILLNSIYPVLSGVAVGAGLQTTVAVINLCCFYLIGLPVGILLGYVAPLQVKGIWIGMIVGVVTQTLALCYMAWKTNWDNEVAKAEQRLQKFYLNFEDTDTPLN